MIVVLLWIAPQTFAQTQRFEGFAVELGYGSQKSALNNGEIYDGSNVDQEFRILSGSKRTSPAIVGLTYGFKLSDHLVVGLGLDYNGTPSAINSRCLPCTTPFIVEEKVRGRYGLYVTPGYSFSSNSLAYLKLGYSYARRGVSFSFVDGSSTSQYPIKGGPSNHGTVVGIGYKQFIMDQWYGFFDYSYTVQSGGNYKLIADANTSANWYSEKLRTELFMLGVGYKF